MDDDEYVTLKTIHELSNSTKLLLSQNGRILDHNLHFPYCSGSISCRFPLSLRTRFAMPEKRRIVREIIFATSTRKWGSNFVFAAKVIRVVLDRFVALAAIGAFVTMRWGGLLK